MNVRASVVIPAHNKATTLPLTVDTVLRQSMPDLEVLVLGDGVTDAVRAVVDELARADDRVRFLDFPKGPHHGERYRHDAVMTASSDAIFYLCDDDLLLPDHVSDLLSLLEDHDLVQCLNGRITPEGQVRFYPGDLARPETVELVLSDLPYHCVSITGTAHTRRFYELVGDRWETTPEGWSPDHYQFNKLLRHPGCRAATSPRMTALQFPTHGGDRATWTDEARAAELKPWHRMVTGPGGQATVDRLAAEGAIQQLVAFRHRIARQQAAQAEARQQLRKQRRRIRRLKRQLRELRRAGPARHRLRWRRG